MVMTNKPTQSYGEIVRMRIKTGDNPTGQPLTLRDVAKLTGYSYEHIRKTVLGEPVGSEEYNSILCEALGLDPTKMWQLAQYEKAQRKYGPGSNLPAIALPSNSDFATLWEQIGDDNRRKILKIMEGMAMQERLASELASTEMALANAKK